MLVETEMLMDEVELRVEGKGDDEEPELLGAVREILEVKLELLGEVL